MFIKINRNGENNMKARTSFIMKITDTISSEDEKQIFDWLHKITLNLLTRYRQNKMLPEMTGWKEGTEVRATSAPSERRKR